VQITSVSRREKSESGWLLDVERFDSVLETITKLEGQKKTNHISSVAIQSTVCLNRKLGTANTNLSDQKVSLFMPEHAPI